MDSDNKNAAQDNKATPASSSSSSSTSNLDVKLEHENSIGTNDTNNTSDITRGTNNTKPDVDISQPASSDNNLGAAKTEQESSLTTTTTTTNANDTKAETATKSNTSQEMRLLESILDDVIFCECLQVHRAAKMGLIFTEPGDEMYRIKDGVGLDVFGQPLNKKKQLNCTCPECSRNISAARLAPHLEKCMGMGRLSARAASNKRDATLT